MKFGMLIITLLLVSCGKDSGGSNCSPTKQLMSNWTSRTTGNVYLMSGCTVGSVCEVKFGSGACDDNRGDFLMQVNANGTAIMGDCSGNNMIERANYKLRCDNTLALTYESDGEVEVFD